MSGHSGSADVAIAQLDEIENGDHPDLYDVILELGAFVLVNPGRAKARSRSRPWRETASTCRCRVTITTKSSGRVMALASKL